MALPRALAAFLLLGSLFHTARADTLVTSGTYTWTSSIVGQVEVTVRVYRDVTGHPGLLKWDYEIHNISMHNYYEPCYAYPTMDEGISEFLLWFPAAIRTAEINEETLTLPEGWEYWPIYDGENYTAIVGFSIGAVESANIIEAGESAHVTFLTEPRAIEELDGGAAVAPWVACAMKIRSLERKSPTVKAKDGARRLELSENSAGGNILAPGAAPSVQIQIEEGKQAGGSGFVVMANSTNHTNLTAVGSPAGGTYTWETGSGMEFQGASNVANVSVRGTSESLQSSDTWVRVTYTLNGTTVAASVRFTVRVPTEFRAATMGGTSQTTGNESGYLTLIVYGAYDRFGNRLSLGNILATETLSTVSSSHSIAWDPPDGQPRTGTSDTSGAVWDYLSATREGGLPSGFSATRTQFWNVGGYAFVPTQSQLYRQTYAEITRATLTRQ
jgi:hypothetical protein